MSSFSSKLLIVDDCQDNLFVIRQLVEEYIPDCQCFTSSNAINAIHTAEAEQPDGILSDIFMPAVDGIQLCELVKCNPAIAHIPIILMTSHNAKPELFVNGLEAGAHDFIVKPIENSVFAARIKAMFRIKQAQDQLKKSKEELEEKVVERTLELVNANQFLQHEVELHKKTEFKLQFNQFATEHFSDMAFWIRPDATIEHVNLATCQKLGYTLKELQSMTIEDFEPQFTSAWWAAHWQQIKTESSFTFESCLITKSGDSIPVEIIVNYLKLGELEYNCAFARDISKRKKTETELRENESFLTSIIEHIPHIIFVKDASTLNFLSINPAGEKLFGVREDKIIGKNDYDFFAKTEADFFTNIDRQVLKNGKIHDIPEEIITTKDMGERILHTKKIPVFDEFGNAKYILGISEDTTEWINEIKEKTELQGKLLQSGKLEAIGTLAGGIAHDFNNILTIILGYSDLALEDAPPGTNFHNDVEKIVEAGNRAKNLVKQILAFSRQSEIEKIPMELHRVVKETLTMLTSTLPSTIEILSDIDDYSGVILADPTHIHQIIMNLCTNASHAMEETGGTLSLTLGKHIVETNSRENVLSLPPGNYVQLIVADSGVGIKKENLLKIFDPYFTTKEVGKGTGMGLAIIHGIITEYGGVIDVESEVGVGSSFTIYLPTIEYNQTTEVKNAVFLPLGNERILYIDDEEVLVEMGQDMLERLGYHVTTRKSSLDAWATFQDRPDDFDLIITDQTMPCMTGLDLARMMLQIRPNLPIILCTGFSNLVDEKIAKEHGIKEFALKPITMSSFASLIRNALDS